jgi:carbamate kinase
VTLLTQIEVDSEDPAFRNPSKPIGPIYSRAEARDLVRERGWQMARDGHAFRRAVPSPRPRRILELPVIELLVTQGITVICAGGGGIPVTRRSDGTLRGVEAVIDKDLASALLARELAADAFLMLTDVQAVYRNWDEPDAAAIRDTTPSELRGLSFAPGSMAPKVEAACEFVETTGGTAGIGSLADAQLILSGKAGTRVMRR